MGTGADNGISIRNTTRKALPRLPFERMKQAVLGNGYELSLVFSGPKRARALNRAHRKKSYVPNVLAFPLSERTGEIFITPTIAEKEAGAYGLPPRAYIGYLFIHGLLHLKGHAHGSTMDKRERLLCKRFGIGYPYKTPRA